MEIALPRNGYSDFHPADQFVLSVADADAFDRFFPQTIVELNDEFRAGPNMLRPDIAAATFGLLKAALIGGGLDHAAAQARAFVITSDVNTAREAVRLILLDALA